MKPNARSALRAIVITSCLAGAAAPLASASAQRGSGSDGYRHREVRSAGTLIVNGCEYEISARGSVACNIAEVLRCAGFDAYAEGSCVYLRYCDRPPRVRFRGCDYNARISRRPGCIVIRPYATRRSWNRSWNSGWDRGWDHGRDRWERRRRWSPPRRRGCSPSWGFGLGGVYLDFEID